MIVSKQIMGTARGPVLAALSCCCGVQREASVCCRSAEDKQLMSLTESEQPEAATPTGLS